MKYYFTFLFIISISCLSSYAQNTPHITGHVKISMEEGLIQCDFKLTNTPDLGKQYKILLNRGFNIGLFRDDRDKVLKYSGFYDGKLQGEAMTYVPNENNDTLKLPTNLHISYTGAFPIYKDSLNSFDFKGLIAFNGKTVRAAEQSKWYPVIYDVKNGRELLDVTYDIDIECPDCETIYLNGTKPASAPKAHFSSDKPRQLLLFAGKYSSQKLSNSIFLNANLNNNEAIIFNENIASVTKFYEHYLKIPYGEQITFMQHQAVEPYGPKRSWGFVTFPTIAVAGKTFKSQIDLQSKRFKDTSTYHFYAHEMGHYYFGQLLQPNSTLKWFFLETMAEFLSVKATEAKYGKIATQKYIADKQSFMDDWKIKPLSQVTNPESIGESYRYEYAPLILLAMEKRFGQSTVQKFLQLCLSEVQPATNYSFLKTNIIKAGVQEKDWLVFENQVIDQAECKNIFKYL